MVAGDWLDMHASPHHDVVMRTTINLPDDLYQVAKTLAEGSGQPLGEVIADLMRRGLVPQTGGEDAGLPVFDVPRGAETIPGNRAPELLATEGME